MIYFFESTSVRGLLPEVFALVSPIHASTFYTALARECVKHLRKGLDILKKLLDAIFNRRFPSNGYFFLYLIFFYI